MILRAVIGIMMSESHQAEVSEQRPLLAGDDGAVLGGVDPANHEQLGQTFKRNLGTLEAFAIIISIVI
jgi:hypothetical protein